MAKKKTAASEESESWGKSLLEILGLTAIMLVIWYLVFSFVLSNDAVSGPSMEPTFENNDRLISVRHTQISRNDVVVIKAPDEPGALYIKRVIGMPGDKVVSKNDKLYINGKRVAEPYLNNKYLKAAHQAGQNYTNNFSVTVPKGYYWVMGDHRDVSKDSRKFGPVKKSAIVSEVKLRYWPFNRISLF
ncbi:signal peptidase I [Lactobacillus corticis]|uniref:Signal peptidase I n=1 Tax=Lactobacillus corticis TaxID=2201249 RepID=A0A916QJQ8_9LACO|nr:signal peptidase I [Lactobacillus corticis]GFZ27042.1 signal peptidase I [Lactobacillus corticis]